MVRETNSSNRSDSNQYHLEGLMSPSFESMEIQAAESGGQSGRRKFHRVKVQNAAMEHEETIKEEELLAEVEEELAEVYGQSRDDQNNQDIDDGIAERLPKRFNPDRDLPSSPSMNSAGSRRSTVSAPAYRKPDPVPLRPTSKGRSLSRGHQQVQGPPELKAYHSHDEGNTNPLNAVTEAIMAIPAALALSTGSDSLVQHSPDRQGCGGGCHQSDKANRRSRHHRPEDFKQYEDKEPYAPRRHHSSVIHNRDTTNVIGHSGSKRNTSYPVRRDLSAIMTEKEESRRYDRLAEVMRNHGYDDNDVSTNNDDSDMIIRETNTDRGGSIANMSLYNAFYEKSYDEALRDSTLGYGTQRQLQTLEHRNNSYDDSMIRSITSIVEPPPKTKNNKNQKNNVSNKVSNSNRPHFLSHLRNNNNMQQQQRDHHQEPRRPKMMTPDNMVAFYEKSYDEALQESAFGYGTQRQLQTLEHRNNSYDDSMIRSITSIVVPPSKSTPSKNKNKKNQKNKIGNPNNMPRFLPEDFDDDDENWEMEIQQHMAKKRNQRGVCFRLVCIALLLAILAVMGYTGYKIRENSRQDENFSGVDRGDLGDGGDTFGQDGEPTPDDPVLVLPTTGGVGGSDGNGDGEFVQDDHGNGGSSPGGSSSSSKSRKVCT